ncbi:MAG: VCBS repeat-containing protein [Planctomycetota bacterium]|nr:VCBS repeat-containing protein [Planctomycetota bacterium]
MPLLPLTLLLAAPSAAQSAAAPRATLSFEPAARLVAAGVPIQLNGQTTPRFVDWDGDGRRDLLVAAGDGRIWLCRGDRRGALSRPEPVAAAGRSTWGERATGAAVADMDGDGLGDLFVGTQAGRLHVYLNRGKRGAWRFEAEDFQFGLPPGCGARFDVGDLDGDGTLDIVTGEFEGPLRWMRGMALGGEAEKGPYFEAPERIGQLGEAYNSAPRLRDLEGDGDLDLLMGVNWGYVALFEQREPGSPPSFGPKTLMENVATGQSVNLRELIKDNTTPELADVDGDGVLDLVSGGLNGTVWWMRGVGHADHIGRLELALADHGDPLGLALKDDEALRGEVFGALRALQNDLGRGFLTDAARRELLRSLLALAKQHPGTLRRARRDPEVDPFGTPLFGQFTVVLKNAAPDSAQGRRTVARALGEAEGYARLLVDLGVVFVDNARASEAQLEAMHEVLSAMPEDVWDVEVVGVADWVGPGAKNPGVKGRSGVNIFAMDLGVRENSFGPDSPRRGVTDVYLICLAHEVAHNMLDTVGRRRRPELFRRKFQGLQRAAGDAVVFHEDLVRGMDRDATRARFRTLGLWNGEDTTWDAAWTRYFHEGRRFDRSHIRGNVEFFLKAPQEAFATLANQWFADSELMVEFAKVRFDAGQPACADQMLLIAEYLSDGGASVPAYHLTPGGEFTAGPLGLQRDPKGRIKELRGETLRARFSYTEDDLVESFELNVD